MAEKYRFMDAVEQEDGTYDREYNAQEFTDYFKALVTTGVMKGAGNQLTVTANGSNMITKVDKGIAFLLGRYYENDSFKELSHDTETLGNSRIDRVVIQMDLSTEARHVLSFIKKGVPSANPVAPPLTQTPNLYEISLAQVKVVGGQTFIATNAVTDERGTNVICPWAGSNILPSFDDNALAEHLDDNKRHKNGNDTTETGLYSNAEGNGTKALGTGSHAEGVLTTAQGVQSHAEGAGTLAAGTSSHAEGWGTFASGSYSHAEGRDTSSMGEASHAEGMYTKTVGEGTHAEGYRTEARGHYSHSEGYTTISAGNSSHAQGYESQALGNYSHAGGNGSKAIGEYSFASGDKVTADVMASAALGRHNKALTGSAGLVVNTDDAFVIGNGIQSTAKSNAFRVRFNGAVHGVGAFNTTGADYAEFFEWLDGNVSAEDRVGFVVTLDGDKIRKATTDDDYILGIISANPSVIGDSYQDDWQSRYILDAWGRIQYDWVDLEYLEPQEEGTTITVLKPSYVPVSNPDWNNEEEYIPREQRKEWGVVGLMGKLYVRDDGSSEVNGFSKVSTTDGALTKSNEPTNMRVLERVSDNIVRVFIK